jgi:hypothetical protein
MAACRALVEADAGAETDGTPAASTGAGAPPHHDDCALPAPPDPPAPPPPLRDADGRPVFAAWEALACTDLAVELIDGCTAGSGCLQGRCLLGTSGDGVCAEGGIDATCGQGLSAMGWRDGLCWGCVAPEVHASACCTQAGAGFDCRLWPYPHDGVVGSVCARHEDCEPGLLCGAHAGAGFGICSCPESEPLSVAPADDCY